MGWEKINLAKYSAEVQKNLDISGRYDLLIKKDLLLTLILSELQKESGVFHELVFKGGTLLLKKNI